MEPQADPPRRDALTLALYAFFLALIAVVVVMLLLTVVRV
jgi:hypothetical protein